MFDLDIYATGLAVAPALALGGWLASLALRNAGTADSLWSLFFIWCWRKETRLPRLRRTHQRLLPRPAACCAVLIAPGETYDSSP